jgi:ligand-binding SRPBCC domain-containing protein
LRVRTLPTELWLPRPIAEVFAFFSDAHNLDVLTPPWLGFRVLTPRPVALRAGAVIDYRLKWRGVPLSWRTEIAAWEPPHRFVDRQARGPYRLWVHEHSFTPHDGGTLMRDRVEYAVPGWLFEPVVHGLVVGPDVRRIFAYRQRKMRELFAAPAIPSA